MKLLEVVRAGETRDAVYPVLKDDDAKRVAAAWSLCTTAYEDADTDLRDARKCYDASWDRATEPPWGQISMIAGTPMYETHEAFSRLKMARLVYPDGTIHQVLMGIIRAEIGAHVRGLLPTNVRDPLTRSEPPPVAPKKPRRR